MKRENINWSNPNPWEIEKEKFIKYYQTKDEELKKELINDNLGLIRKCKNYVNDKHNINKNDLVSYGYEGLLSAIEKFNPLDNDCHFSTFAFKHIIGYMLLAIPKELSIQRYFYYKFYNVRNELDNIYYDDSDKEINEILDKLIEKKVIDKNKKAIYYSLIANKISLDEIMEDNNVTENNDDNLLLNAVINSKEDFPNIINNKIFDLSVIETKILSLHFGFEGKTYTNKEISKILKISEKLVYEIELKTLHKLREKFRIYNVSDYINDGSEEPHLTKKIK